MASVLFVASVSGQYKYRRAWRSLVGLVCGHQLLTRRSLHGLFGAEGWHRRPCSLRMWQASNNISATHRFQGSLTLHD